MLLPHHPAVVLSQTGSGVVLWGAYSVWGFGMCSVVGWEEVTIPALLDRHPFTLASNTLAGMAFPA